MQKLAFLVLFALAAIATSKHIERRSMREPAKVVVDYSNPFYVAAEENKKKLIEDLYPGGSPPMLQNLLNQVPRDYDKIWNQVREDVDSEVENVLGNIDYSDPDFDMEAVFGQLNGMYEKLQKVADALGVKIDMNNDDSML